MFSAGKYATLRFKCKSEAQKVPHLCHSAFLCMHSLWVISDEQHVVLGCAGTFEEVSKQKGGYRLPRSPMINADLARLINSDEVQRPSTACCLA